MINRQTQQQIIDLAQKLIRFRTTTAQPEELLSCASFIEDFSQKAGLTVQPFTPNNKPSLLITPTKKTRAELFLLGHFDVVPGPTELFTPQLKGNRLYGRGTLDMKSQVATMLVLTKQLSQEKPLPPVGLLLTSDEEIGGFDGTNYLIKKLKLKPKFVLAGEPTWLKIGNAAKGIIRLKLMAQGKSAHAAKPWEGKNAAAALAKALAKIERAFPTPGQPTAQTTVSITTIRGGEATNQVPARCQAQLDIRYTPTDEPAKITTKIRKLVSPVKVAVENIEPAAFCELTNKFITSLSMTVKEITGQKGQLITKEAASDVRFFTAAGTPGIVFGPGGGGSHAENEWVDLKSLFIFYEILEGFILAHSNPPKR